MLEAAADKIRYEDEDDEDGNDERVEKNHQYSRVSECEQLLSNEQKKPRISCEKLKAKESDCLVYCDMPGNEKKKKMKKEKIEKATTMRMQNCAAQSIARSIF